MSRKDLYDHEQEQRGVGAGPGANDVNEQLESALRSVMKIVGGWMIAHGVADGEQIEAIIGGVTAVLGVAWSITEHKKGTDEQQPK